MFRIFTILTIIFGVFLQISAQCGVYFKESNRQVFSNSFSNGVFEDFDGDGLEDLFGYSRVSYNPPNFQVHFYKRLSENSFDTTAKSTLITNVPFNFGVFGDVNGDGKKDLIGKRQGAPTVLLTYLNDGTGNFSTTTPTVNAGADGDIWAAGDLNGDGKDDVVMAPFDNLNTIIMYYRLTQPDNSFGPPVMIGTFNGVVVPSHFLERFSNRVLIEDFNGDGAKDIAFVGGQGPYTLKVLTNNGSLSFTETLSTQFNEPSVKLTTFDINNDGKKDFVSSAGGSFGSQIRLAVNNGNNTFTTSFINLPFTSGNDNSFAPSSFVKDYYFQDFDNDGDKDFLYPGTKKYAVLVNQGNGTFVAQEFKGALRMDATANLDGDGKRDAVSLVQPIIDGAYRLNDGNNNFYFILRNAVSFSKNICDSVGQTKIVDFNADGVTDRAFWNTTNGSWRYTDGTNTVFNSPAFFQWGIPGDVPVANDYDGDAQTDYAVYRPSTGTWWVFRSAIQQPFALNFGISEDKPVPADYDGDGRADIAVFRPSTGDWHIWLSQTNQYGAVHFGATGDKPVPADYDGDGRADVAVFRPSEAVWYRLNSSDLSVSVTQYGNGTDKLMPADYDGDGRANIAVFRDGVWYVLRPDFSTTIFNWGIANDEPFVNDSPKPYVGVFRRSSSQFWTTSPPLGLFGSGSPTGSTTGETFVSSILPQP